MSQQGIQIVGSAVAIVGLQYVLFPAMGVVPTSVPTVVTVAVGAGAVPVVVGFVGSAVSGVALRNLIAGGVIAFAVWIPVAEEIRYLFGPVHGTVYGVAVGSLLAGAAVETRYGDRLTLPSGRLPRRA